MKVPPIESSATATDHSAGEIDAVERALRADLRIAAIVRGAPMPALPSNFAVELGRRAQGPASGQDDAGSVERSLLAILATLLVGAAAWYVSSYPGNWFAPLLDLLPDASTLAWLAAAVGCVGLNWLLGRPPIAGDRAMPLG